MLLLTPTLWSLITTHGISNELHARDSCSNNFSKCNPNGATSSVTPSVGSGLSSFYVDLLHSIHGIHFKKRGIQKEQRELDKLDLRAATNDFCCADGTDCLLLQDLKIPFCYDKFTTNYFLPGGAFGTVVSGDFISNGDKANLITGNFTLADGKSGNIYGSPSSPLKPNTSTLTLPSQFTSSGVGSAIPITALGQPYTFTTTFPGTTISPRTISLEALTTGVLSGRTFDGTTLEAEVTVPGTTILPQTATITTISNLVPSIGSPSQHSSTSNAVQLRCTTGEATVLVLLLLVMLNV